MIWMRLSCIAIMFINPSVWNILASQKEKKLLFLIYMLGYRCFLDHKLLKSEFLVSFRLFLGRTIFSGHFFNIPLSQLLYDENNFQTPHKEYSFMSSSCYSTQILCVVALIFIFSSRNAVFVRKMVLQLDVLHLDVNEVIISHVDFRENVFSNSLAILRELIIECERRMLKKSG